MHSRKHLPEGICAPTTNKLFINRTKSLFFYDSSRIACDYNSNRPKMAFCTNPRPISMRELLQQVKTSLV